MANILLEATNSIHTMYEIESIINNDDIPAHIRDLFMQFMTESLQGNLTARQQRNIKIFRKLYVRVDKDIRFFRNFLDLAVSLAETFKFENTPIVYAFKNISLEEHFLNFLDFASRQNLIIEKNNPLQLFISLGCSIITLALKKNQNENLRKVNESKKQVLFAKYSALKKGISRRFIDMDFGLQHDLNDEPHAADLDDFNCDTYDDDERPPSPSLPPPPQQHKPKHDAKIVDNNVDDIADCIDVLKSMTDTAQMSSSSSSSIINGGGGSGIGDSIIKTLENGDTELNIQKLDSLVMEAGLNFVPAIMKRPASSDEDSGFTKDYDDADDADDSDDEDEKNKDDDDDILNDRPIVRLQNNYNIHNILDFTTKN